jgi:tRNA(Ile)-lysidine synthase
VAHTPLVGRGLWAVNPLRVVERARTPMRTDDFITAFHRHFPDLVGRRVLVGLSGGADSVTLVCVLRESVSELGCPVCAVHVHHHLRGPEADVDAAHCVALCERLGVPLEVRHLEPERPRGSSPEAWWRQERYRVLEEARVASGSAAVATAHSRDDQAETVLLKLLRGAGPRGVAGIRRRNGLVVRPLLDFRRAELREFLVARAVTWREDTTNLDHMQPRARVRNLVLPLLAEAFPGTVDHLAAFAGTLAEDDALVGALLNERGTWPEVGGPVSLAATALLPAPLLRRWALELARRLPLAEPLSRQQLDAIACMVAGGSPAAVDLGRRWVVRRRGATLMLCPPPLHRFESVPAHVPSVVRLPGGFVARLGGEAGTAGHCAFVHARLTDVAPVWRPVAPGERFSGVPVSRLLARAGVPAEWRRAWPVLSAGGTILWLPAVGVAEGWLGNEADGVWAELEEPWERHVR